MVTILQSNTPSGGSVQIIQKLTLVFTGSGGGVVTVPHGMTYTPTIAWQGLPFDVSGPAAGPTLSLDTTTAATGMDGTNVYLYVSGPGTCTLFLA